MTQNKKANFIETSMAWFFLIATAVLALNQIVAEAKLFDLPNYLIYRSCLAIAYGSCIVMIAFHVTSGIDSIVFHVVCMFLIMLAINSINKVSWIDSIVSTSWCVSFICGNYFEKCGVMKSYKKTRILIFAIILCFVWVSVYRNYTDNAAKITNIIGVNYLFYFGFPLLLWVGDKDKKYELFLSICTIMLTILSFKRTSLLAIGFAMIVYYYLKYGRSRAIKGKGIFIFSIIVLIIAAFYMSRYTDDRIITRFGEISDTGGNGRADIWKKTIELFSKSSPESQLFGHGYNYLYYRIGYSAHNDFLEFLYSYGVVFAVLYVFFILRLFVSVVKAVKKNTQYNYLYAATFILMMIISSFSHVTHYPYVAFPLFYLLGGLCSSVSKCNLPKETERMSGI